VIIVRVLEYQITNRETYRLITTITAGIRDRPRNSPDLAFPRTALDVPS
jgi:hypothetical protein